MLVLAGRLVHNVLQKVFALLLEISFPIKD